MRKIIATLFLILFSSVTVVAGGSLLKEQTSGLLGGRTGGEWTNVAGHIEPTNSLGVNVLIKGTNKYLNFNTTVGTLGYGFRDNAGSMEFKDSGGLWAAFGSGSGGGGSSIWSTTTPDLIYYYNGARKLVVGAVATSTLNSNFQVTGGIYTDEATTTGFTINGERFTDLTGTGLSNVGGVLTASGGSGDLVSTNNLSDVSSAVLSAHNLFDDSIFAVATVVPADKILMKDVSGSNVLKTVTAQSIADLATDTTYTVTSPITLAGSDIGLNQTAITSLGTIGTGVWQGTSIGDSYITKTGDWTGTFDGQEGSYYLDRANHTGSTPLTSLALAENNIYVGDSSNNPSASSDFTISATGDLIPTVDDSQNLGSVTNTFKNGHFKTENDTYVTIRQLAGLHRDYSEEAAILPSSVSESTTGGVWTITVTDTSGAGYIAVSLNDKVIRSAGSTLSVNATALAGTDALPKTVYVYIQNNGSDVPELVASNTSPEGVVLHAHVASYKAGAVAASATNIYGKAESIVQMAKMATNVYHRFFVEGPVYNTGLDVTAISSDITIGIGSYEIIFDMITTASKQVSADGLFHVKNDGTYNTETDFSFDGEYSDGVAIADNKVFNTVLGVMEDDTTRIMALVQKGSVEEYRDFNKAYEDKKKQTVYQPSDTFLKNIFVPVARIIVKRNGASYDLQQFDTGLYYEDIRGTKGAGGGSSALASNIIDGTADGQMTFWNSTLGEWNYTETSELYWNDGTKVLSSGNAILADLTGTASGNLVTADINTYSELNTIVADQTLAYGGGAFHDGFSDFVANEHLDWTANVGTINAGNYTDTNTTYTAGGTLLDLTGTVFSLNEGTLTDNKLCTYQVATGLNCNHTDADTTYLGGTNITLSGNTFNLDNPVVANLTGTASGNLTSSVSTLSSLVSVGTITTGTWNATPIDFSSYTNATGGTSITLTGDSINVDDDFLKNNGDVGTGVYDFGGATSFEIVNAASPTVDATGECAIDTTADDFVYYGGSSKRVLTPVKTKCIVVEDLAAADDNMSFGALVGPVTIKSVWCNYAGTGTTVATISLEDGAGNAMTHTSPTCVAQGTVATAQSVTAANALTARELLVFDVDNAVSPETDTYTLCVSYELTAQ